MKQKGFALTEVTIASSLIGMVFAGCLGLLSSTIKSFGFTSNQYDADVTASLALQHLNRDLQEAKRVTIISPTRIRVHYLQRDANGTYIRNAMDENTTIDFYRGNANFSASSTGSFLIKSPKLGTPRTICKNVGLLQFHSFTPSSVDVTLRTEYGTSNNRRFCEMIHRAIFLRNY